MAESAVNRWFQRYFVDVCMLLLYPPVGRRCGAQSLPIDPGDEPLPLCRCKGECCGICVGPSEVAAVQTSLTKPDAGAIPNEEFDPVLSSVAKGVGTAVAGRTAKGILDTLRKSFDARTHVDWFDDQPDLAWRRSHGNCLRSSASHGVYVAGSSMRQPPGLCSRTTPLVVGAPTLIGTSVSDEFSAAINSFSLARHR